MNKWMISLVLSCLMTINLFGQLNSISFLTAVNGTEQYRTLLFHFGGGEIIGRTILQDGPQTNYYEGKYKVVKKPNYAPNDLVYEGYQFKKIGSGNLEWEDISFVFNNITTENKYTGVEMFWNSFLFDNKDKDGSMKSTFKIYKTLNDLAAANIVLEQYINKTDALYARIQGLGVSASNQNSGSSASSASVNNNTSQQTTTGGKININVVFVGATNDPEIGSGVVKDAQNFKALMNTLFPNDDLKYNLIYTELIGSNFNKNKVVTTINSLSPKPNDVVLFYCSSHGVNKGSNNYPDIAFNNDASSSLNLLDIQNALIKKNNRLNLVIGDMCNNSMDDVDNLLGSSRGLYLTNRTLLNRLFEQASGYVTSASASKYEYSWNTKDDGGQFTHNFITILKDVVAAKPKLNLVCDWGVIFKQTYKNAYEGTKKKKNQDGSFGQNGFNNLNIKYK